MLASAYAHIEITPDGVPIVSNTTTKVVEVVLDRLAHHWDMDEIHRQHPHLTLAQICSALAYYYDHKAELDQVIEKQLRQVNRIKNRLGKSPVRQKLEDLGLLP